MTSHNGNSLDYNSLGMVTSMNSGVVTYTYGIGGAQIRRETTGTTASIVESISSLYEIETKGGVVERHRRIQAAGGIVAISTYNESDDTEDLKYLIKDHLGSTALALEPTGNVIREYSYDPWGLNRKVADWTYGLTGSELIAAIEDDQEDRGFTGHQKMGATGLIHMNGRVYDPYLASFTSCDPYLGSAERPMDMNRYIYLGNNPLSGVDPSGYFGSFFKRIFRNISRIASDAFKAGKTFVKKYGRTIASIAVTALVAFTAPQFLPNVWGGFAAANGGLSAIGAMTAGAIGGAASAAIASGGDLSATLQGALFGMAFGAVGGIKNDSIRILAHGALGGARQAIGGGDFKSGFFAGAFTAGVSSAEIIGGDQGFFSGDDFGNMAGRIGSAAVVGGTISEMTGGNFSNGAITGAFSRAFNDELHELKKVYSQVKRIGYKVVVGQHMLDPDWDEVIKYSGSLIDGVALADSSKGGLLALLAEATTQFVGKYTNKTQLGLHDQLDLVVKGYFTTQGWGSAIHYRYSYEVSQPGLLWGTNTKTISGKWYQYRDGMNTSERLSGIQSSNRLDFHLKRLHHDMSKRGL